MTTGKTIALTRQIFVGKVMSLLFNTLLKFVIDFLPRSKHLLISRGKNRHKQICTLILFCHFSFFMHLLILQPLLCLVNPLFCFFKSLPLASVGLFLLTDVCISWLEFICTSHAQPLVLSSAGLCRSLSPFSVLDPDFIPYAFQIPLLKAYLIYSTRSISCSASPLNLYIVDQQSGAQSMDMLKLRSFCVWTLTWTRANSKRYWGTGRPGMLQSMGSQRVRQDLATGQQ